MNCTGFEIAGCCMELQDIDAGKSLADL